MRVEKISKINLNDLVKFIESLDDETLFTYTRWNVSFDPSSIAKKIVKDNELDTEIAWVAYIDNNIVGYQHVNFSSNYRNDVVRDGSLVLKSHSGKGIGSILKKKCVEESFKKKFYKVIASVYENNWSSLHNNLKNGFLIAGIFFNEEKSNGRKRFVISTERPIEAKITQKDIFKKLQEYSNKQTSSKSPKKLLNKNYNIKKISRLNFIKKIKDEQGSIFTENQIFYKSAMKLPKNISPIISVEFKNQGIYGYAFMEFFDQKEKSHVAKLFLKTKINSEFPYYGTILKIIELAKICKIEKIWINVLENNSLLINGLSATGFIVESIAFGNTIENSKPINSISFAYHLDKNLTTKDVINMMKELIHSYSPRSAK